MTKEIKKEHIEKLIHFLRNEATDSNFKQSRPTCCWGAWLSHFMGKPKDCHEIILIFRNQFPNTSVSFVNDFMDGDFKRIADEFEEEVLNKYFEDEWVTSVSDFEVTVYDTNENGDIVGSFTMHNEKYFDVWDKNGNSKSGLGANIKKRKNKFIPEIGVYYIVTNEFTNYNVTYPAGSVLIWLQSVEFVTASLAIDCGRKHVNITWKYLINFDNESFLEKYRP